MEPNHRKQCASTALSPDMKTTGRRAERGLQFLFVVLHFASMLVLTLTSPLLKLACTQLEGLLSE